MKEVILKKGKSITQWLFFMSIMTVMFTLSCKRKTTSTPIEQFTLKIIKTGTGSVNASYVGGSATDAQLTTGVKMNKGTAVTLTATPDVATPNVLWNGTQTGNTYTVTMDKDQTIAVAFSATPLVYHSITFTTTPTDAGTMQVYDMTGNPVNDITKILEGAKVRISILPAVGKVINTITGVDISGTDTTLTMTADKSISATFGAVIPVYHSITFTATPADAGTLKVYDMTGNLITDITKILENTKVRISIIPTVGYKLNSVLGADISGTDTTLTMTADNTMTASFVSVFTFTETATTITLTKYNGTATEVTIPDTYNGKPVTAIGSGTTNSVFNSSVTNVIIPNSVTTIGQSAFQDCSSLTSITIPNSVETLGIQAFFGCSNVTNITIGSSVTSIGNQAFQNCSKLTTFMVDASNTAYSDLDGVLFDKLKGTLIAYPLGKTATEYTIPNSVTTIGASAFQNNTILTSVTLNNVTTIGNNAFYNCSSLTSIIIPNSVTNIGDYAFQNCSSLMGNVTIGGGSSATTIGKSAFKNCDKITSVTIGSQIAIIDDYTFQNCSGLTGTLTIPSNVTRIGHNAFSNCSGLTGTLTIPNTVTKIGIQAFQGCSGLTGNITIPNGVTQIESFTFSGCSGITSVTIPSSVTYILGYAFQNCIALASVRMERATPVTDNDFFKGCTALTSIQVPSGSVSTYQNTAGWKDLPVTYSAY